VSCVRHFCQVALLDMSLQPKEERSTFIANIISAKGFLVNERPL
jgi:hypothetical protein